MVQFLKGTDRTYFRLMAYALYLNDPEDHWVIEKLKEMDTAVFQQNFFTEYASGLRVSLEPLV